MAQKRSPEALTLLSLRSARDWSQKRLAEGAGLADEKQISRYESGEKPLSRERLDSLVAPLGYDPEAVDTLVFAHKAATTPPPVADGSPVALTPEELRIVNRAALSVGLLVTQELRVELARQERQTKAGADRREAGLLWSWIKTQSRERRRRLVENMPELRNWALAVRLCEESERAAAHRADVALELAGLALAVARRVPGGESWRSCLQGFAWAFVGNARRVANDFDKADNAFEKVWSLWRAGKGAADLLPEWRLFDLEASLRREQHRFSEALELLGRARALCGNQDAAAGRILLKKSHVLERLMDFEGSLAALREAAPSIVASGDLRLLFALRFNTAANLCHLGHYTEAAKRIPEVRELVIRQADELAGLRVLWLEARVLAGLGRAAEAGAALEQVQRGFTAHDLPYDAALSSLELATLRLDAGRTAEVRELALGMAWIFASKKIEREALAALSLFCEAAGREAATVSLTRDVIARIEEVRRSAPRPQKRGRA